MITEPEPTAEQLAKEANNEFWNCIIATLFCLTFIALGILNLTRASTGLPYFGWLLVAIGLGYIYRLVKSFRRYRELRSGTPA